MSTEEDYKLREIQREYLDFLDDDVGAAVACVVDVNVVRVKCQGVCKQMSSLKTGPALAWKICYN